MKMHGTHRHPRVSSKQTISRVFHGTVCAYHSRLLGGGHWMQCHEVCTQVGGFLLLFSSFFFAEVIK